MATFGYFWLLFASCGYFWQLSNTFGVFFGQRLVFFCYFWLLLFTPSYLWLLLDTFGYFWLLLAPIGFFLATRIIWTNVSKFWVKFWENIFSFGKRINFFTLVSDFMGTFICINSFQKCWSSTQINANSDKLCRRRQVRKAGLLRHNLDMFLHIFKLRVKTKMNL